jgi:YD repeat-containing protein
MIGSEDEARHAARSSGGISLNKTQYSRFVGSLALDAGPGRLGHGVRPRILKVTTSALGEAKNTLVFDSEGRVEQSIDLLDGQEVPTTFVYGSFDLIRNVIDAEGNVTSINYDKRGRRWSLVDPDRGVTFTTYNGFDEVLSEENALGQVTTFKRDLLGRVFRARGRGRDHKIHLVGAAGPPRPARIDGEPGRDEDGALVRRFRQANYLDVDAQRRRCVFGDEALRPDGEAQGH